MSDVVDVFSGTTFHPSSSPSQSGLSSPVDSPASDADSTFSVGLGDSPVEVPQSEYANSSAGYPSDLELEESEFEGSNTEALGSSGELSPVPYAKNDAFLPAICTGPLLEAPNFTQEAGQEAESEGQQVSEDVRPVTPENQTGSLKQPVSTPVAGKPASTQDGSVSPNKGGKYLKDLRQAYAMEMRKKIAQVSVDTFMEEFVPGDNLPSNATIEAFDRAGFNRQEKLMYDELCKVANSVFSHVRTARSLIAKDTHCWGDQTDKFDRGSNRCPDVMIYPADGDATKAYTIEPSFLAKKTKEDRQRCVEKEARTAWLWASLLIEAKGNTSDSPFVVPNSKQETNNTPTSPVQQGAAPSVPASDTSSAPLAVSGISSTVLAVSGASSPSLADSAVPAAASDASPTHDSAPTASAKPPTVSVGSKAGAFLRLNAEGGAQTMGQMAEYVSKVLRRRFLSCFFTIFVCREYAWLLRWDRAGLVVSEPFNFLQQPYLLHNFFYRFASMNDVQRGEDPTVIPASAEDATCMRSFNNFKTDYERDAFKAALVDPVRKSLWPVYKILMPEDDMISAADLERGEKSRRTAPGSSSPRMREFLISRPHFMSSSVVGRGTLCHIAYDVSEKRAVFLKQYWRLDFQTHHPEGEVYMRLHSKKVEYIATPIAAGDVRPCGGEPQCTRTQEFLPGTPPKLIQYRLIVEEVAAPLKNYANSRQLVGVIYHATLAHEQAWTQASVLHRDISVNNILIYSYRNDQGRLVVKGLLIDWGLCKYKEELGRPPSQGSRSGTWQFISAVLLAYPGDFGHEVWHDIESFIHVLHWMCFRFHKTNLSTRIPALYARVSKLYDTCDIDANGESTGGMEKMAILESGTVPFKLIGGSANGGLSGACGLSPLLQQLAKLCAEHYRWLEPRLPGSSSDQKAKDVTPDEAGEFLFKPANASRKELSQQFRVSASAQADARPVLKDHAYIQGIFEANLSGPWTNDDKMEDNFEKIENFLRQQSQEWRYASKRSSDGSLDSGRSAKRMRSSTRPSSTPNTSQLGSIVEAAEN